MQSLAHQDTAVVAPDAREAPVGPQQREAPGLVTVLASETYPPDVNGAAYFVHRLAAGLAQVGHEVHVIAPGAPRASTGSITVHPVPAWPVPGYPQVRFASPLSVRRRLRHLLSAIAPDVVHVQNHFTLGRAIIGEARHAGIAVVATNHFMPENFTCYVNAWPRRVLDALELAMWRHVGAVYRDATLVTAPTSYALEVTQEKAGLRELTAVSCGIDLERFASAERQREVFRETYGLPAKFSFLHVGRLDPEKHVEELVSALAIARLRIDAQLIVVGRGEQRSKLERHARSIGVAGAVHFCGFVPDELLPGAYALADVYVNAGRAELQSISTLESLAAAKPVLLSRSHALPLLVGEGENGWTYTPGAAAELAARLVTLHDEPSLRRRMGEASRARAARHALGETVAEFERLYRTAVVINSEEATSATISGRSVFGRLQPKASDSRSSRRRWPGTLGDLTLSEADGGE